MISRIGRFAVAFGLFLAAAPSAFAGLVTTQAGMSSNGYVDWGVLGGEVNDIPPGYYCEQISSPLSATNVTGLSGLTLTGSIPNPDPDHLKYFARKDQGGQFKGNFNDGDHLLLAFFSPGPMEFVFSSLVQGAGAYISTNTFGTFTAVIEAFDKDGNSIAGQKTLNGTSTGPNDGFVPAIFIGFLSDYQNVKKITFNITNGQKDKNGLDPYVVIDTLYVTSDPSRTPPEVNPNAVVPLPSAAWMGLGTLAGLVFLRTRRRRELV